MIVVDRIEGTKAVCDCKGMIVDLPLGDILGNVKEGDVLTYKDGKYIVDEAATEKRREESRNRFKVIVGNRGQHGEAQEKERGT